MTKAQFRKRYRELVRNVARDLLKYGEAALRSGSFDLAAEEADRGLPKDVLAAGLETQKWDYAAHDSRGKNAKRIKNIIACTPRT